MLDRRPDVDPGAIDAVLSNAFGNGVPVTYARTPDGVSTQVYRVVRGNETFYLRVAEEEHENLETDAALHRRLLDSGVKVPDIVHVEAFNAGIGRSVMVTTEVRGRSLATQPDAVIEDAGADIARINRVSVDGFGWIQRTGPAWPLTGEYPTYEPFLTSYLPVRWPGVLGRVFGVDALDLIERLIEQERSSAPTRAVLAHGDFDASPIFADASGYTGLIDFGEIRGTERFFDLGHFYLHDEGAPMLPALLRGYERVTALPSDYIDAIRRSAILLGLRQLCRWLGPLRNLTIDHPLPTSRVRRINELLQQSSPSA
jgi:aminoglycoside phosphotransferase (APT) family kinase protein